jgi:glycosyltransferase involved in cell wall biosynthesis
MSEFEKFSVLMSIYEADDPDHFDIALKSVWNDQHLKPDQIVLVCDGKLTSSLDSVVLRWSESLSSKLTVVRLKSNLGLAKALNHGLDFCRHDLVMRMDSDDISLPKRFSSQVKFLMNHKSVSVSSGHVLMFDETGEKNTRKVPIGRREIANYGAFRNPMNHPSVAFRKSKIKEVGGYPLFRKGQDYALWSLLLVRGHELKNQDEIFLKMRGGTELLNRRDWSYFVHELRVLRYQKAIGFISGFQFIFNFIVRLFFRIIPNKIKKFFYRYI